MPQVNPPAFQLAVRAVAAPTGIPRTVRAKRSALQMRQRAMAAVARMRRRRRLCVESGHASKSFRCNVAVNGTLGQLVDNLNAPVVPGQPDAMHRPLPGVTTSAYDALSLTGCLP